jgi:heat shock protein HslJ
MRGHQLGEVRIVAKRALNRIIAVTACILVGCLAACSMFEPAPKNAPEGLLESTQWQLQQLGAQGAIAGSQPTMTFAKGGAVSGSGSCNRFNGSVTISGKSIAFGPLAATKMSCAEALNAQEASYFKALQEAQWFTVAGATLTMYTKAMEQPLVFFRTEPK